MRLKFFFIYLLLIVIVTVSSNTIYVQNKCHQSYPVVLRGAWGKIIARGNIKPGKTWKHSFDRHNCESCNIAITTGKTLLAECK
jgi:hypothetical protein